MKSLASVLLLPGGSVLGINSLNCLNKDSDQRFMKCKNLGAENSWQSRQWGEIIKISGRQFLSRIQTLFTVTIMF